MDYVGRILECVITKISERNDWFVLECYELKRNVFLHISEWNKFPNEQLHDDVRIVILGYDNVKNRYIGSLKILDEIEKTINELDSDLHLDKDEKDALYKLNFSNYFINPKIMKTSLADLIINYRFALNLLTQKKYQEAFDIFNSIVPYYKSKEYLRKITIVLDILSIESRAKDPFVRLELITKINSNKSFLCEEFFDLEQKRIFYMDIIYKEINQLIECNDFSSAKELLSPLRKTILGDTKLEELSKKLSENYHSRVMNNKSTFFSDSFIKVTGNGSISSDLLKTHNKYYLIPYYRYHDTVSYSEERQYTIMILDFKSGDYDMINHFASLCDEYIPNEEIVLCYIPSSTAHKQYYMQNWNEYGQKVDDLNFPINPPLADLIFSICADGESYNSDLSQERFSKINQSSKRIDGSKILERFKSVLPAHSGGDRSVNIHLNSIKVNHPELILNKDVWVLDDVITTGNSMKACEALLRKSGAKNVYWFSMGKTTEIQNVEQDLNDMF
jgi:hypothetical protein